jgi:hypothetical protein
MADLIEEAGTTCRIFYANETPAERTVDPDAGFVLVPADAAETVLYSGPCWVHLHPPGPTVDPAGGPATEAGATIRLPRSAPVIPTDLEPTLEVTAAAYNPGLVGAQFIVHASRRASLAVTQQLAGRYRETVT